jgi:hypothetical protein
MPEEHRCCASDETGLAKLTDCPNPAVFVFEQLGAVSEHLEVHFEDPGMPICFYFQLLTIFPFRHKKCDLFGNILTFGFVFREVGAADISKGVGPCVNSDK